MNYQNIKVVIIALLLSTSNIALAQNCVQENNTAGLSYEFYRLAAKPLDDDNTRNNNAYKYYPGSGYFTGEGNITKLIESTSFAEGYFYQWANRCHQINGSTCGKPTEGNGSAQGNLPEYKGKRFYFDSHIKANMCTLAQAVRLVGDDDDQHTEIYRLANKWEFEALFTDAELDTHLADNNDKFENACYIYGVDLSQDIEGIVLDYEVQDNRHINTTTNFLTRYSKYIKGKDLKALLYTNFPGSPGWTTSGFSGGTDGNAHLVFDVMDGVSLLIYPENSSDVAAELYNQSRLYTPENYDYNRWVNRQKFYVIVGLKDFALDKSQEVREFVINKKHKGVATWNNLATFDNDCDSELYQVIDCLAYGTCAPTN